MRERRNEEIKRRTRVVRIFPNAASCLRLVRALCADTHEGWLEDHRSLHMEFLKEQKKELRLAASPITASALNLQLDNLTYTTLRDPAAALFAHLRTFGFCSPWRGQDVPSPGCRPLMARPTIPQRASADARGDPAGGKATCLWRNTTSIREAISRASLSVSVSWYCRGSRFTSTCINLQTSPSAATWTTSRQKPVQLRWKHASSC